MNITVTTDAAGRIVADTPYHPSFPAKAKALGGKFDSDTKCWSFDPRDEAAVRAMLVAIFGTDGTPGETVTVRITATDGCEEYQVLRVAGREVIKRPGRDLPVRQGEGVVKIAGTFAHRGGSAANPKIGDCTGIVLEVRDLPVAAVEGLARDGWTFEVVDTAVDKAALAEERARLMARIAEIDALLG